MLKLYIYLIRKSDLNKTQTALKLVDRDYLHTE